MGDIEDDYIVIRTFPQSQFEVVKLGKTVVPVNCKSNSPRVSEFEIGRSLDQTEFGNGRRKSVYPDAFQSVDAGFRDSEHTRVLKHDEPTHNYVYR